MGKQSNDFKLLVFTLATFISFDSVFSAEIGDSCVTPNGENAKCIPIDSCDVIRKAITYLNEAAVEFAKQSQCGYDDGPLVCCGSTGRRTTPAPKSTTTMRPISSFDVPPAIPINHALLPDETLCGFHFEGSRKPGMITGMTEFPWMAALHYNNDAKGYFRCSGVLISSKYVVTTADCLFIPNLKLDFVRLGEWQFSEKLEKDDNGKDAVIDVPVVKTAFHPYYSNRSGNNNIALLQLDQKIKYSDFIRPICLPPIDFPPPPPGSILEASGWGLTKDGSKTDVKMKANVVLSDYDECQKTFPRYRQKFPNRICAEPVKNYDFCNGETGTPIVKSYTKLNVTEKLNEQWYLEGFISKGFGCVAKENDGSSKAPSLYLRVSRYVGWIINNIRP